MSSPTTLPRERKGTRTLLCLLLYLLSAGTIARTLAEMQTLPEKLGALCIPLVLLGLGCWFAFKEGGRVSRISASVLAMLALGSFGFGIVTGVHRHDAGREIGAQLHQIHTGLLADSSDGDLSVDAVRRHAQRLQDAARRTLTSDQAKTAAAGRFMESVASLTRESDQRLLAAIEATGLEDFLDVRGMLTSGEFGSQRDTVHEYQAAAKASSDIHSTLPAAVEGVLAKSGMTADVAQYAMNGFNKVWPLSGRVLQAHVDTAESYAALIDFIEVHRAEIDVLDDGGLVFRESEAERAYGELNERITAAAERVDAAIDGLVASVTKH